MAFSGPCSSLTRALAWHLQNPSRLVQKQGVLLSEGWGRSSAVASWLWELLLLFPLSLVALRVGGRTLKDPPASPHQALFNLARKP